ncbi:MAG: hypothetical protein H6Q15_1760, partial [Bacteroidetes bacterium]|nr:hypothetical protein [Bacteroidota bacterium]
VTETSTSSPTEQSLNSENPENPNVDLNVPGTSPLEELKKPKKDNSKPSNKVNDLMEKYGVSELFENSKGEFFTTKNLALASEKNCADKVKTHKK